MGARTWPERDFVGAESRLNTIFDLLRSRFRRRTRPGGQNRGAETPAAPANPGRYIRLEPRADSEHRDQGLPHRPAGVYRRRRITGQRRRPSTSEQKFLQVKRIIERFRGREGQSEADQKWTRLVTDVRNWYTFTASERYREDDSEYETYADSGGKSGGQKEKLAYTILAASLAYQFKLEWGAAKSRTFRFAVIDEAFGRGSDESTRFALELFGRARPATADRHPAAEDSRDRALRVGGRLRRQPDVQVLPAADG